MSLVNVITASVRGRLGRRKKRSKLFTSSDAATIDDHFHNHNHTHHNSSTWRHQSHLSTLDESPEYPSSSLPFSPTESSSPFPPASPYIHPNNHNANQWLDLGNNNDILPMHTHQLHHTHPPTDNPLKKSIAWLLLYSPFKSARSKRPNSRTSSIYSSHNPTRRKAAKDLSSKSLFPFQAGAPRTSDMSQDFDLALITDSDTTDQISRIVLIAGPEHFYHLALQLEMSSALDLQLYAKDLFIRSAGLGYAPAQFKLGICYELGLSHFPSDPSHSFAWYKRAAMQGHADAELAVSGWYLTGHPQGLVQSEPLAYEWAAKAARRGWSKAEYTLGHYHEVGIGVPQDLELAKQWYLKAAARGNERALLRLLVGHVGLAVDYAHLKDALLHHNGDNPYLIHQLAQFHELREYGLVPDEDAAFELYAASAQANYAPAQYRLGACYEFGILGCPQDPVQAVHWYSQGAENGHVEALLALAGFYLDGSAGPAAEQSDDEAFRYVKAAAQRGVPKAEYITGFFLEYGLGVEKNTAEARQWYHLACAKGVDSAERRLQDLEKAARENSQLNSQ